MTGHTRFSRFVSRVKERREEREQQRFEFETKRLMRQEELEQRRARIRKQQAVAPVTARARRTTGVGRAFAGFQTFATEFARRQEPAPQVARVAAPRRVARPAPVRRRRRRARRQIVQQAPVPSPFAPTIRI